MSLFWSSWETDRFHQLERVAGLHDSGFQFEVECEPAVFEVIFEMKVLRSARHAFWDPGQSEIVCCDHADGVVVDQGTDNERGSFETIMRVGPGKKLIEKKKNGDGSLGEI